MTFPPPLRTPAVRSLLVAYPALAGILPAAGRPWLTVPLCLIALAATGALWIRALPGLPAETGVPAARPGLAAAAGLITMPLLALALHAVGHPVRPAPLAVACAALVTVLGVAAVLRDHRAARRSAPPPGLPAPRRTPSGPVRTAVAVTIPLVVAVGVGGWAVRAYLTAPHPAEPGYLSVALNGWAAAVDGPVTVPARGLVVPVRVTSAGIAETTPLLQLRVGGRVVASRSMTVAADSVRSLTVYVPALPPDGRLRNVAISVGATSVGFYARGHADTVLAPQTTVGAAVTGPGVGPHAPTGAGDATGSANVPPARPGGDRASNPGVRSHGDQSRGVRAPSAGDRTGAVRAHSGGDRAPGVRARPRPVRAAGARPVPVRTGGVRTPSAASGGAVPAPTGGIDPWAGLPDPALPTGGAPAGTDDHTRSGGTKGGRAKTGPAPTPALGPDGSVWLSPDEVDPDPSRVACSGKRRAVLAGEGTPC
ncbi:hypothetical protein Q0Z83_103330 [Actinoplanes sichuanensis]|uniref:Uncharacterized protein n=1 Tax=Actinoplanes sichuanensis TaxID=512349 RepID=A0ABW4AI94_9ACTN|nr:hypothetical protein [Actinoplanes sichuanensis]BEL12142.1 hypothetical protein Q0Z83_103330 [Actinoplanes sichuanensis]